MLLTRLVGQIEGGLQRRKWARGRGPVRFDTSEAGGIAPDVAGQTDAFTGEPLDARRGLYRCDDCRAASTLTPSPCLPASTVGAASRAAAVRLGRSGTPVTGSAPTKVLRRMQSHALA